MKLVALVVTSAVLLAASEELFEAARKGDVAGVRKALDSGAAIDAKWRYDQTALFIAAKGGHLEVVKLLLDRGASVDVKDSFYGMSLLDAAAMKGDPQVIGLLAAKSAAGADRVLMTMAGQGKKEVVEALLQSGVSWPADTLSKALSAAQARKQTEVVALLEKAGAQPPKAVVVDPSVLASYAGRYKNDQFELAVATRENGLQFAMGGQTLDYAALDTTSFEPVKFPGMVKVTFVSEGGKVTGLEVLQGGNKTMLKRVEEASK